MRKLEEALLNARALGAFVVGLLAMPMAAEAALVARYLDADATPDAYYDTTLNITWLANANAGAGSAYDNGSSLSDGAMTWGNATAWAGNLAYSGSWGAANDWRLPDTDPINGSAYILGTSYIGSTDLGYNVSAPGTSYAGGTGSEMAHLFFNTLGNLSLCNPVTSTINTCTSQSGGLTNTGHFVSVQAGRYWSGTDYVSTQAWIFNFAGGNQGAAVKTIDDFFAWAVHSGDVGATVAPVPLPAAAWLLLSGLGGLGFVGRRRKANCVFAQTTMAERTPVTRRFLATLLLCSAVPVSHATAVSGQGTWETTLQARDFDGNPATIEGYYDTVLGITWLNPVVTGTAPSYANAVIRVNNLTVNGIGGWRMPIVRPLNGATFNTNFSAAGFTDYGYNYGSGTQSEMVHLFYTTLGNIAQFDTSTAQRPGASQVNWGLVNTGLFNVIQPSTLTGTNGTYWTQTPFPGIANPSRFVFNFYNGQQVYQLESSNRYLWAVHDGSVGNAIPAVPLPAAAWLLLSGLAGLGFIGRRKAA